MAYLDDTFQTYAIGANLPLGSWTGSGFTAGIVAEAGGTGIPGTDRKLTIFLGSAEYDRTTAFCLATFTQFCALQLGSSSNSQPAFAFVNGPNGSGNSFTLLQLRIEPDATLTLLCPQTGEILANSGDAWLKLYSWNLLQINVTLTDVLVAGVLKMHVLAEVALDGKSVLTCNVTTTLSVGLLANGTSEVNRFQLVGGDYGAYTLEVLTAINTYPHAGAPTVRAIQSVIEVDELLDSGKIDVYQAVTEIDVLPDSGKVTVHQCVIEVNLKPANRWYVTES